MRMSQVLLFFKPYPNCCKSRSWDYIQLPCLHSFLMHSFIPRQVHQGDTKQGSSSLSSAVEQNSHERINISEEAIESVDPQVPVYNLASSQDTILQKKGLILFILNVWCSMKEKRLKVIDCDFTGWQPLSHDFFASSTCLMLMERMRFAFLLLLRRILQHPIISLL